MDRILSPINNGLAHLFYRMCYSSFLHRYGLIIRNTTSSSKQLDDVNEKGDDSMFDPLDALFKRQLDMPDSPRKTPRKRLRRRAGAVLTLNPLPLLKRLGL